MGAQGSLEGTLIHTKSWEQHQSWPRMSSAGVEPCTLQRVLVQAEESLGRLAHF